MSDLPTILIADQDSQFRGELQAILGAEYEIVLATDGTDAFEAATSMYPDLILYEHRCPLIGLEQFLNAAATVPRTNEIKLIALFDSKYDEKQFPVASADRILERWVKPLNPGEVRSRVASILHSIQEGQASGGRGEVVTGSLGQISSADLLQIFSVNRRTGCLRMTQDGVGIQAEIYLDNGAITEAVLGETTGKKAFHRIMEWNRGHFEFHPNEKVAEASLSVPTDRLLMNALREMDELRNMKGELPQLNDRISVLPGAMARASSLEKEQIDLLSLIKKPTRVGILADEVECTDLVFFQTLTALREKGFIQVEVSQIEEIKASLSPEELADFIFKLSVAPFAPAFRNSPKMVVFAASHAELMSFQQAVEGIPRFRREATGAIGAMGFGTMGSVALDADLRLELMGFVADKSTLPLAAAILQGCVLAMVIRSQDETKREVFREFLKLSRAKIRIPIVEIRSQQLVRVDRVLGAAIRAAIRHDTN